MKNTFFCYGIYKCKISSEQPNKLFRFNKLNYYTTQSLRHAKLLGLNIELVEEKDNFLYTGATSDLKNRLQKHKEGKVSNTKHRLPVKVIYCEICLNKNDAFARERYLKSGMGKRYIKNRLKNYFNKNKLR